MEIITPQKNNFSSVDLVVYRNEIISFLKSASIKYEPLIEMCDIIVERAGRAVDHDPSTRKYYLNLRGLYYDEVEHDDDRARKALIQAGQSVPELEKVDYVTRRDGSVGPIQVWSYDSHKPVLIDFTRDNLIDNPKTAEYYSAGEKEFEDLCALYPDHADLIKNIRYPVTNVRRARSAKHLTYLYGDESILEDNERDSLIKQLNKTLKFISFRWDFTKLNNEAYTPWIFYGMIWQILVTALFAQRFDNLKTNAAHSWNVWQYITSMGLDDYSDILSFSQSMFLYRNLNYLMLNRGKQSNLIILEQQLLSEWQLTLLGRDVIQRTDIGLGTAKDPGDAYLYPDLVAKPIGTDNEDSTTIAPMTIYEMIEKLADVNSDYKDEVYPFADNAKRQSRLLSNTTVNTFPSKVVEIIPNDANKKYKNQFSTFLWDTLLFAIAKGYYKFDLELPSMVDDQAIEFSAKESILLFDYCLYKSIAVQEEQASREAGNPKIVPEPKIPERHFSALAFKDRGFHIDKPYILNGFPINLNSYVDMYNYTNNNFEFDYRGLKNPKAFSQELVRGFETLVYQSQMERLNGNSVTEHFMQLVTKNMLVIGYFPLHLTKHKTYTAWLDSRPDVKRSLLAPIEKLKAGQELAYEKLAGTIMDTLVPIIPEFNFYGTYNLTDASYARLKSLFIDLTSYNINFIEDAYELPDYFYIPPEWTLLCNEIIKGDYLYDQHHLNIEIIDELDDFLASIEFNLDVELTDVIKEELYFQAGITYVHVEENATDIFYQKISRTTMSLTLPE